MKETEETVRKDDFQPRGKRGVAIVLVVGILSILMLAGVAFSICMRTERIGAGTFRYSVQARHMLWAALVQAVDDIDQQIDGAKLNGNPMFLVFPTNNYFACITNTPEMAQSAMILSEPFLKYLPGNIGTEVADTNRVNPRWHVITDTLYDNAATNVKGRYSYIAVDMSGMIDANFAGGAARIGGERPGEIQLAALGGAEIINYAQFTNDRLSHVRYETYPELYTFNNGLSTNPTPPSLGVYARSPPGRLVYTDADNNGMPDYGSTIVETNDLFDISGDESALTAKKISIKAALVASGIDPAESDFVFSNLLDYVDVDNVPRSLAGPYTESVPMINEIVVSNACSWNGGSMSIIPTLYVECWYPFVRPSPGTFTISADWEVTLTNTTSGAGTTRNQSFSVNSTFTTNHINIFTNVNMGSIASFSVPANFASSGTNVFQISSKVRCMVLSGGNTVDAAPANPASSISMAPPFARLTVITNSAASNAVVTIGRECIDPRFNWESSAAYWVLENTGTVSTVMAKSSLGATNYSLITWYTNKLGAGYRNPGLDERNTPFGPQTEVKMYVSDAGRLKTVGELGNLLIGQDQGQHKFRTIRLFDREANYMRMPIYEHFSVTSGVRRGLVNMNTRSRSVLRAVFHSMPFRYPDSPTAISIPNREKLIRGFDFDYMRSPTNQFYDIGQMGDYRKFGTNATPVLDSWDQMFPALTDLEKESLISHSAGLFTVRHNYFTILIVSEAYSPFMGVQSQSVKRGRTLASATAVAEIWRDPFRDANGRHKYFIRRVHVIQE